MKMELFTFCLITSCGFLFTVLWQPTSGWERLSSNPLSSKQVGLGDAYNYLMNILEDELAVQSRYRRAVDQGIIDSTVDSLDSSFETGQNSQTGASSGLYPGTGSTIQSTFLMRTTSFEQLPNILPTLTHIAKLTSITASIPNTTPTTEPIGVTRPTSDQLQEDESEPTLQTDGESTPEPTSEPLPEGESTPEPTSEPLPVRESTLEPTSEPLPEGESTPEPTSEPLPEGESTPEPTSEPLPEGESTPEPPSEPLPEGESTAEPTSEPYPESEAESIRGTDLHPEPEEIMNISAEPRAEPGPSIKTDLFVSILSILILLILIMNITLIVTILKTKALRKPTNVIIISLGLADISIACFVIPGVISAQFSEMWMAIIICKICHFVSHMSLAAGSFSLVAIALDRLRAIALPLKPKLSMSESGIVVAIVWLMSTLYGFRAPFLFSITPVDVLDDSDEVFIRMVCGVPKSESITNAPLVVLDFIIVFALPAITILASYVGLLYFLSKNTLKTQFSNPDKKQNTKAVRLSILMISLFIVCHLPVHSLRLYISRASAVIPETFDIIRVFDIISFMNSLLDPIVYGFFNKQIRVGFLNCIGKSKSSQCKTAHNRIHPRGVRGATDISKIATVVDSGANTSVTRLPLS